MAATTLRTVWLPKDSWLGLLVAIPLWGIAGVFWGLSMSLLMGGAVTRWLVGGILWAIPCFVLYCVCMLITTREVWIKTPLGNRANLRQRLAKALKGSWYTVEQESPTTFVCEPAKRPIPFISLECNKLYVEVQNDSVDLIGPAHLANRVRKKLPEA